MAKPTELHSKDIEQWYYKFHKISDNLYESDFVIIKSSIIGTLSRTERTE